MTTLLQHKQFIINKLIRKFTYEIINDFYMYPKLYARKLRKLNNFVSNSSMPQNMNKIYLVN